MLGERPKCPYCHKALSKEEECGFFLAIEAILRKIMLPSSPTRWACKNEHNFNNHVAVEEWERKYEPTFREIERQVNSKARKFAEKQAKKGDFKATIGQLQERFQQKSSLPRGTGGIAKTNRRPFGNGSKGKNDKPITIRKRPPDFVCCSKHYKFRTNLYGAKVRRKKYLFFKETFPYGVAEVKSIF